MIYYDNHYATNPVSALEKAYKTCIHWVRNTEFYQNHHNFLLELFGPAPEGALSIDTARPCHLIERLFGESLGRLHQTAVVAEQAFDYKSLREPAFEDVDADNQRTLPELE